MKKNRLKLISNFTISLLLYSLIVISILGSSAELVNDLQTSTNIVVILFLLLVMLGVACIAIRHNPFLKIRNSPKWRYVLLFLSITLTILWQFNLVFALAGRMGWDPASTSYVSTKQSLASAGLDVNYFSYYPNNFLITAIGRWFWNFLNLVGYHKYSDFVIGMGLLNYLLVDLSILLLYRSLNSIFNKKISCLSTFISWIMMGFSPVNVIPYTDTYAYFIGIVLIFIVAKFLNSNTQKKKVACTIVFGLVVGIGYYIKPTTFIFSIALGIIAALFLAHQKKYRNIVILSLLFMLSFGGTYLVINQYQRHNSIVKIDYNKAFPMSHFIAMGMKGNGGYSLSDVKKNIEIKDPEERRAFNNNLIKKELSEKGMEGYISFLVKKQIKNTQNGTFGWGEEGNYLYQLFKQKGLNQLQKKQRKIFMFYKGQQIQGASVNWTGHKLTIQMIWLVVLIGILFSLRMNSFRIQLFKLSVLGGMLFLLIFEGGRSRYLIQFLPFLFVLSGVGMNNLFIVLFDKYSE